MLYNTEGLFSLLFLIYSFISIIIIMLERKRPEKTIAWLLVLFIFPPAGLVLYIFLGRNWKKHKLNEEFSPYVKELIYRAINRIPNPEYIPLIELLAENSDSPLFIDNDISVFKNGEEKFAALKNELLKAKHHIHLEYYIVKSDGIGNELKSILIQKAKEGVSIKFIIDRVGSIKIKRSYIQELKRNGIDVVYYSYFLAPLLRWINTQINYRNHKKIAIIDGQVGFLGGINIGDEYLGKSKLGYWRDTHLMIKGDCVLGLQAVFINDFWTIKKTSNSSFFYQDNFEKFFPNTSKSKGKIMQLVTSGPDYAFPAIMQTVFKMITMAKNHIYITTPYFVPSESIMDALKIASLGGIDVRILFPGKYDHFIVYHASKTYLQELIRCGVKVYYYDPTAFIHSKVMTIDGKFSTVGTANMDIRSYELNYEINAVLYDSEITEQLESLFFEDLNRSKKMTLEDYDNDSKIIKLIEAFARLFSSLL